MLTRFLFLSSFWFLLSFIGLVAFGSKIKAGNIALSFIFLLITIALGDVIYSYSIGYLPEIRVFSLVGFGVGTLSIFINKNWNVVAKTSWAMMLLTTVLFLIYTFGVTAFATASLLGYLLALIFFFLEVAALALSLSYAYEALDVLCRSKWVRRSVGVKGPAGYYPKVSIHVPAYSEPPDVVSQTLVSLGNINYPNFEVLVIDNNTKDENLWRPLLKICKDLGPRFKFFHLDNWPGYKSGALNFALSQTASDAEIIAIVDADYLVDQNFLKDLIPYFFDSTVAFVQTPQDYRNTKGNSFFRATYLGYKYFFEISMRSRNENNAIIFAGTMGLIRKSILTKIGGWDEWCITEDAEASLRILKMGYQALYINKSYGTGLMPLSFDGFKKQRFRWCFGGIQILKKHWASLMPWSKIIDPKNQLTGAQKYYYLFGGLQWYNDLLNLFFTLFLILGGILNLFPEAHGFLPLTTPLLILPGIFLLTGLWRFTWVLKSILHLSFKRTVETMENFFSLGWAVALGSVQGLLRSSGVFLRTPKIKTKIRIFGAVAVTQWETLIGIICIVAASVIFILRPTVPTFLFAAMLVWESSLFLSAPFFSLVSLKEYKAQFPTLALPDYPTDGQGVREGSMAKWLILGSLAFSVVALSVRISPTTNSNIPPPYSKFNPAAAPISKTLLNIPTPPPTPTPAPTDIPNNSTSAPNQTSQPTSTPTSSTAPQPSTTPVPSGSGSPAPTSSANPSSTPAPTSSPIIIQITPAPSGSAKPSPAGTPAPSASPA